ncbi:MAG: hypothetical protein ACK559_42205, partial [bacterium]
MPNGRFVGGSPEPQLPATALTAGDEVPQPVLFLDGQGPHPPPLEVGLPVGTDPGNEVRGIGAF